MVFSIFNLIKNLNKNLKILFLGRFFGNIIFFTLIPFLAFYLDSFTLNTKEIGDFLIYRSIFYILGLFIGGSICEIFNKKKFVFILLLIISFLYFLLSFNNNYNVFFYVLLTIGFLSGLIFGSENVILIESTNNENRAEIFSFLNIILNITATISPPLTTNIFLNNKNLAFFIFGLLNMLYSFLFLMINYDNSKIIKKNLKDELLLYLNIFKDFKFILIFFSFILSSICYCFITTTLPLILKKIYLNPQNIFGIIMMINTIIVIILQFPMSKIIKKIGNIKSVIFSQFIVFSFFIIIKNIDNIYFLYFSIFILSIGEIFKSISENLIIIDNFEKEKIGEYTSLYKICNLISIPISTFIGTYCIIKNNINTCFLIFSTISLLSLLIIYIFKISNKN